MQLRKEFNCHKQFKDRYKLAALFELELFGSGSNGTFPSPSLTILNSIGKRRRYNRIPRVSDKLLISDKALKLLRCLLSDGKKGKVRYPLNGNRTAVSRAVSPSLPQRY